MTPKHLFILFVALFATSVAQNEDDLYIPVENDNQFPPDNHPGLDLIPTEGSGAGVIEEPLETITKTSESLAPVLKDVQLTSTLTNNESVISTNTSEFPASILDDVKLTSTLINSEPETASNTSEPPALIAEDVQSSSTLETKEPVTASETSESPAPVLEDVQLTSSLINNVPVTTGSEHACPTSCVCNIEGDSNNYIVDCSNADLTDLPQPLDSKTTELNLQNNKLTIIPKDISALKDLKILNVNNNDIMDIVAGSISELPELTSLKLGNNRLIEYPTDLKNSFGLTKLEELDLGGNDMRTDLKTETFSNFKALRKLVLPTAAADLVDDVCAALKESLETVCTGSCDTKSFECLEAPPSMDDDLLDFALPGLIALGTAPDDNGDPSVSTAPEIKSENANQENVETPAVEAPASVDNTATATPNDTSVSFRATVMQAADEKPKPIEAETKPEADTVAPTSDITNKTEEEVVGATTTATKTGGVDKSVIGIIVAGMVVVVAGITIKKNWSSIKKRFSSTPRSANVRTGVNANGTTPEEVPLQDKNPA